MTFRASFLTAIAAFVTLALVIDELGVQMFVAAKDVQPRPFGKAGDPLADSAMANRPTECALLTHLPTPRLIILGGSSSDSLRTRGGLARFAPDDFAGILDAFSLIRLRRRHTADGGRQLADLLFVRAFHDNHGWFGRFHRQALGNSDEDGMRKSHGQLQLFPFRLRAVADSAHFQFLPESFRRAFDRIGNQCSVQAMQRSGGLFVIAAREHERAALQCGGKRRGQRQRQRALRTQDLPRGPLLREFDR